MMNQPPCHPIREIQIASIINGAENVRPRLLDPEFVDRLAESMDRLGLLKAIVVRPDRKAYQLVSGASRLAAAQLLGWISIKALVLEGLSKDRAALAGLHESMIGADLSPAERAILEQRLGTIKRTRPT
jgi:ParB/RepB/Spo0J family partition protein